MTIKILNCFVFMYTIFVSSNLCDDSSSEESAYQLTDSSRQIKAVREKEDERFVKDISALGDISDLDLLREEAIKYRKNLKILRIDYFDLYSENCYLLRDLKLAEKILCHLKIKLITVEEIENYEAELDEYEFNNTDTASIFQPDTSLINNLPNVYARREEHRRQRWSFYLERYPTKKFQKLKEKIDKNSNLLEKMDFSSAIAKLHRRFSTELRESAKALKKYPNDFRLCLAGEEYKAIPVLLKGLHLSPEIKKEIDYQFDFERNSTDISDDLRKNFPKHENETFCLLSNITL